MSELTPAYVIFAFGFLRRFKDTLPVQEPGRIIIIVDVADRPEIREVQDRNFGKIRHVVDDTVGLVA